MKKILGAVLALAICGGLYFGISHYMAKAEVKSEIQWPENYVLAATQLGYGTIDAELKRTYINTYIPTFTTDTVNNIDGSGDEYYLIIPRYKKSEISIYSAKLSENGTEEKDTLIKTFAAKPFTINCNFSDLYSNCIIEVKLDGKTYEYSPSVSLKDGGLNVTDFVYDITIK